MTILLSPENVVSYLVRRGLIERDHDAEVRRLDGGVSCLVLGVVVENGARLVIKQALERLDVAEEWIATPERAIAEAEALRIASRVTPKAVPQLLYSDPVSHLVVIDYAPEDWHDWKTSLLVGDIDPGVAAWLGGVLASWHTATLRDPVLAAEFDHPQTFEQLRINPYHRTLIARHAELRNAVEAAIDRLFRRRCCLVHGDFSPKNVLVGESGRWVVDFEVAHFGDPCFDVAFMLTHLFLKALHRPTDAHAYQVASVAFYNEYAKTVVPDALDDAPSLMRQTGCLMLARVDGKSPAEYLLKDQRDQAWSVGVRFLQDPPESIDAAWQVIEQRLGT